ncbi:hypothetical protein Dimus_001249 [Dionaea muscipula]
MCQTKRGRFIKKKEVDFTLQGWRLHTQESTHKHDSIEIWFCSLENPRVEEVVEIQSPPRTPASSGGVGTFRVGSSTESSLNSSASSIGDRPASQRRRCPRNLWAASPPIARLLFPPP